MSSLMDIMDEAATDDIIKHLEQQMEQTCLDIQLCALPRQMKGEWLLGKIGTI